MSKSYSRAAAARDLLALLPPTVPKKYRERLREISANSMNESVNWTTLLEELKYKSGLVAEIDRIIEQEQKAEQKMQQRAEERKKAEVEQNKEIQKMRDALLQQRKSVENSLFGDLDDDCNEITPRNICKYSIYCDTIGGGRDGECR